MTIDEFYEVMVRGALKQSATEEETLPCMIVLHTHKLTVNSSIELDIYGRSCNCVALTQRHSASIVASVWKDTTKPSKFKRREYTHWYYLFQSKACDIEMNHKDLVEEMKWRLFETGYLDDIQLED